jgi:hypothetical protein
MSESQKIERDVAMSDGANVSKAAAHRSSTHCESISDTRNGNDDRQIAGDAEEPRDEDHATRVHIELEHVVGVGPIRVREKTDGDRPSAATRSAYIR